MSPQAHCFPSPPCVHCLRKFTGHPGRWEGGTRRGGEQGPGCRWAEAQPPVVSWAALCGTAALVSTAVRRGRPVGSGSSESSAQGRNAFFPFCVCERWRVFARAAVHGAVSGGVSPGVGTAQGGSPPAAAARLVPALHGPACFWGPSPPGAPRTPGGHRGRGGLRPPRPVGREEDGIARIRSAPSKPQLPGADSGPAGSDVMCPSTCGHRPRGQRGQSRSTGCPRSAAGPGGPAPAGAVPSALGSPPRPGGRCWRSQAPPRTVGLGRPPPSTQSAGRREAACSEQSAVPLPPAGLVVSWCDVLRSSAHGAPEGNVLPVLSCQPRGAALLSWGGGPAGVPRAGWERTVPWTPGP